MFSLALASIVLMGACGCEKKGEEVTPSKRDTTVVEPEDMIWSGKPYFNVPIANNESVEKQIPVRVRILTDTKKTLVDLFDTVQVAAGANKQYAMTTPDKMAPGFYRAICYVNGVNVKKENITSNSGFFTSSNDTNNVSIDGSYYPFPRKIEVLTYEKSVLPEGDDFGRLYQKAGTDKCEGQAFVNVLDQYNVSWLRNHDTIVSGTAHSHDKVYTYDKAENLTSPDTDSWKKGGSCKA